MNIDVQAILQAEEDRRQALIDVDIEALDRLFDDDLVHIHSNGIVHSKSEIIDYIAEKRAFLDVERSDLKVRIYGDIAILTGPIRNIVRTPDGSGSAKLEGFATQVLRRTGDQWRFVNFQFTRGQ